MKKKIILIFAFALCLFCLLSLCACFGGSKSDKQPGSGGASADHVHKWDEVSRVKGTCKKEGKITYACPCGAQKNETLPADPQNHESTQTETTPAGCLTAGLEKVVCKACGVTVSENTIPATGHTWETLAAKAATCGEDGYAAGRKCSVCLLEEPGEKIPATGAHTPVACADKAPTCTEVGYTGGTECSVCHKILTARTEVKATGHHYVFAVTKRPTKEAVGEKTGTCGGCGDVIHAEIAKLTYDPADVWDGTAEAISSGDGTQENPYIIMNAKQLKQFGTVLANASATNSVYAKLGADIVLNDIADYDEWAANAPAHNWTALGALGGTLDGNGHTVYGLYAKGKANNLGLFSSIGTSNLPGTVKNLTLKNVYLFQEEEQNGSKAQVAGALAAQVSHHVIKLENCHVEGKIYGYDAAGGLIGAAFSGTNDGSVEMIGCTVKGEVGSSNPNRSVTKTSSYYDYVACGGLFGMVKLGKDGDCTLSFKDCVNEANVNSADFAGGLFGLADYQERVACVRLEIVNCINRGDITGQGISGGLFGRVSMKGTSLTMTGNTNEGDILCTCRNSSGAGGMGGTIASAPSGTFVRNNVNNGNVTVMGKVTDREGETFTQYGTAGGIFANFKAGDSVSNNNFSYNFNTGDILGGYYYVGGLVGNFSGLTTEKSPFQYCYNTGAVKACTNNASAGGLVGYFEDHSYLQWCYNTGAVTGENGVGGLVGKDGSSCDAVYYSCFNAGSVTGNINVGGFGGFADGGKRVVKQSFNVGTVHGDTYVGAFYGRSTLDSTSKGALYLIGCATDGEGNAQGSYGTNIYYKWNPRKDYENANGITAAAFKAEATFKNAGFSWSAQRFHFEGEDAAYPVFTLTRPAK